MIALQFSDFSFVNSCEDNILDFGENYDRGTPPQGSMYLDTISVKIDSKLGFFSTDLTNVKTVVEIEEIKEVNDKLRKLTFSMAFITKWEDPRIKFKRDHQPIERSTNFGVQCLWWPYTGFVNYNSVKDLNTFGALRRYQIEGTQNGVRSF